MSGSPRYRKVRTRSHLTSVHIRAFWKSSTRIGSSRDSRWVGSGKRIWFWIASIEAVTISIIIESYMNTKYKGMNIEFHILQSFPVTSLNRDDVGSPKTAVVGGVTRARVSSQAWKRQIRNALRISGYPWQSGQSMWLTISATS